LDWGLWVIIMKFFISLTIVAMGVRRLPGSGPAWDDVVGSLRSGRVSALPQILTSMLQSDADSTWSDADLYVDVISNMTVSLVDTITSENSASQTSVFSGMNEWGQSVSFAQTSKSDATAVEKDLITKLSEESTAAGNFHQAITDFRSKVFAVVETCTEQEIISENDKCVLTNSCNTTGTVLYKVVSKADASKTAFLAVSMSEHVSKYEAAKTACDDQKLAITNFWDPVADNTYTKVKEARDLVISSFNERALTICDVKSSCSSNSKAHGLQDALSEVCDEKSEVDTLKSRVEGANNTLSLSDRNYELKALGLVQCLLEKLNEYTNGKWDDKQVSTMIDDCEGATFQSLSISFACNSEEASTQIFGQSESQTCFAGLNSERTYSQVVESMKAPELQLESCADTSSLLINIGDPGAGAGYIKGVVPSASFTGTVPSMSAWGDLDETASSGCAWYCNEQGAATTTTVEECETLVTQMKFLSCESIVKRAYAAEAATPKDSDYKLTDGPDSARSASISGNGVSFTDCV
jgi:hypothetical protein